MARGVLTTQRGKSVVRSFAELILLAVLENRFRTLEVTATVSRVVTNMFVPAQRRDQCPLNQYTCTVGCMTNPCFQAGHRVWSVSEQAR